MILCERELQYILKWHPHYIFNPVYWYASIIFLHAILDGATERPRKVACSTPRHTTTICYPSRHRFGLRHSNTSPYTAVWAYIWHASCTSCAGKVAHATCIGVTDIALYKMFIDAQILSYSSGFSLALYQPLLLTTTKETESQDRFGFGLLS